MIASISSRLAVAVDAGDADDLAGADVERDAANGLEAAVVEHDRSSTVAAARRAPPAACRLEQNLASDHQARELLLGRALASGPCRPAFRAGGP